VKKFAFIFTLGLVTTLSAQEKDKAILKEYAPGYYQNTILKGVTDFQEKSDDAPKMVHRVKIDLSEKQLPTSPKDYTTVWHHSPVSQGNTNTCWCYATTSFYESEVKRITGKEVKLSEMYTVYWEYIERAKYFVKTRGDMHFGEGSETNAVARMMKKYGIVPYDMYTGKNAEQPFHSHADMFTEIKSYLNHVKATDAWDETTIVNTVKSMLEYHMGAIPSKVKVRGINYSPKNYMHQVLRLDLNNYVNLMSLMSEAYYTKAVYDVPDNWWKSNDYMNVPLDVFMSTLKNSLKKGYTIGIGGDVSEAGFETSQQVALIPTFDIPSEYIDESARLMRFNNGATTDDHAMHIVGYNEVEGVTWFLVKDSGSGSRNCGEECDAFGYYFFHEDYVKLKMMTATVHKKVAKDILSLMK
jgi:bleomycin hydrolase